MKLKEKDDYKTQVKQFNIQEIPQLCSVHRTRRPILQVYFKSNGKTILLNVQPSYLSFMGLTVLLMRGNSNIYFDK